MNAKRGRPRKAVFITSWGEVVEGAYLGGDGRLRPIGRSQPAFGGEESKAVNRFRAWKAKSEGTAWERHVEEVAVDIEASPDNATARSELAAVCSAVQEARSEPPAETAVARTKAFRKARVRIYADSADSYKAFIRQLILADPKAAAVELEIPFLADYPAKPEKPQFTLAGLGDEYLKNKHSRRGTPLQSKYRKNLKVWWNEFLKIVNRAPKGTSSEAGAVTYARELTQERIAAYFHEIIARFQPRKASTAADGVSATYVRSRFSAVKAILKYGLDFTDDKVDCRAALDRCAILRPPPERSNPTPMRPEDWRQLIGALRPKVLSDIRMKAMMTLALNCAMHNGEVARVLKTDLDLEKLTFAADRHKTGIPRVAKLWPRTVEAIREYLAEQPHSSPYLFVSRRGSRVTGEMVRQRFVTLRTRAGVGDDVTFEWIRDGAYTCAFRHNPVHATWIGGHAAWTGMPSDGKIMANKYVGRNPDDPNVIACCDAIERHYYDELPPASPAGDPDGSAT